MNSAKFFYTFQSPKFYLMLIPIVCFFGSVDNLSAQECSITNIFFESLGGRWSDQKVTGSDGCKKLVMDLCSSVRQLIYVKKNEGIK